MKTSNKKITAFKYSFLFILLFEILPGIVHAQQLKMYDFVLFGGNGNCPNGAGQKAPLAPGCAVQIGSTNNINGNGLIGSYSLVQSTGNANIEGSLHSGGLISLSNNNTLSGRITVANSLNLAGAVLQVGSGATIAGNIEVNGDVIIAGGTVEGVVRQPSASNTYVGPVPAGGRIIAPLNLPVLPAMPKIISINTGSVTTDITNTKTITKGTYRNVNLSNNKTLTFSDTGTYIFNSITLANSNLFVFDFKNRPTGVIRIYVAGNMFLDKIRTSIINGGSASRIFTETNGNGGTGTYAFTISNGQGTLRSIWSGTVWAPYAGILIGSGTGNSDITGALWSAAQVNINSGVNINYEPFLLECTNPIANVGPDKVIDCINTTNQLAATVGTGLQFNWLVANAGNILSGANTLTPTVNAGGDYILRIGNFNKR